MQRHGNNNNGSAAAHRSLEDINRELEILNDIHIKALELILEIIALDRSIDDLSKFIKLSEEENNTPAREDFVAEQGNLAHAAQRIEAMKSERTALRNHRAPLVMSLKELAKRSGDAIDADYKSKSERDFQLRLEECIARRTVLLLEKSQVMAATELPHSLTTDRLRDIERMNDVMNDVMNEVSSILTMSNGINNLVSHPALSTDAIVHETLRQTPPAPASDHNRVAVEQLERQHLENAAARPAVINAASSPARATPSTVPNRDSAATPANEARGRNDEITRILANATTIANRLKKHRYWNGRRKAQFILNAIAAVVASNNNSENAQLDASTILANARSADGKSLEEAIGWHRLFPAIQHRRAPARSLREFQAFLQAPRSR